MDGLSEKARTHRYYWTVLLAIFAALFLASMASVVRIVSEEGVEGLFKQKRAALERVMPDALPVLDKVEELIGAEK